MRKERKEKVNVKTMRPMDLGPIETSSRKKRMAGDKGTTQPIQKDWFELVWVDSQVREYCYI